MDRRADCKAVVCSSARYGWCRAHSQRRKGRRAFVCIRLEDVPAADFSPPPALGKVEVTEAALAGSLRHKWLLRLLWCAVCVP